MVAVSLAIAFRLVAAAAAAAAASAGEGTPPALEACLRQGIDQVVVRGEPFYDEARQCRNTRVDIVPSPLAVVRVSSEAEVQAAVRCAAAHGVQTCARAGGHGFENAAGCSGGLAIDLEDLQDLAVEPVSQVVHFGAGHTLGQLYYKLKTDHDLVVPGGAESGVGAAGLFLGCGRGMLTQLHGMACDTIQGIRYVDAQGKVQKADAVTNSDMLWMAKGGGGEFPGIVTEFTVQAFPAPRVLHARDCTFPPGKAKALIKTWASHLAEMSDPAHQMFTHITMWNSMFVNFPNLCFDCSPEQVRWFESKVDEIAEAVGDGQCHSFARSWFDQLLFEAGTDHGVIENKPEALMDRNQGYGAKGPARASKNGGYLASSYEVSDEMLDTLTNWTFGNMKQPHPWSLLVLIYNLGGPKITGVPASTAAYSGRGAKFVVHFKHQWDEQSLTSHEDLMQHHHNMSVALERHLPCKGFYNYMDGDMPCAKGDRDRWLGAFFSDVGRMQQIKATADPQGVFQSHLLPNGVAPSSQWPQLLSLASEVAENTSAVALHAAAAPKNASMPASSIIRAPTSAEQPSAFSESEIVNVSVDLEAEASSIAPLDDAEEDSSDTGASQAALAFLLVAVILLGFLGEVSLARACRRRSNLSSEGKRAGVAQQRVHCQSRSTTACSAFAESTSTPEAPAAEKEDEEVGDEFARSESRRSTAAESMTSADDAASTVLAFWPSSSTASASSEPSGGADLDAQMAAPEEMAAPEVRIAVA